VGKYMEFNPEPLPTMAATMICNSSLVKDVDFNGSTLS
jgi:hypothetical protein